MMAKKITSAAGEDDFSYYLREPPGRPIFYTTSASLPGRKSLQEETMQSQVTKFFTGKTQMKIALFLS